MLLESFGAAWTDVSYHPNGTPNEWQYLNVFLPSGPKPSGGYPLLLYTDMGGWSSVSRPETIGRGVGVPYQCLRSNIAVAWFSCTVNNSLGYTGSVIPGRGLWKPTSDGVFATQDIPEKDACLAVQYMRNNALTYGINPDLIYGMGGSAGADAVLFSAYGPERQGTSGFFATGSSRMNGAIVSIFRFLWRAHEADNDILFYHFPKSTTPTPYDGVSATFLKDATQTFLDTASVARYGFEDSTTRTLNANQKVHMWSSVTSTLSTFRDSYSTGDWNAGSGYSASGEAAEAWPIQPQSITDIHSSWHLYSFKRELQRNNVQFAADGPKCCLVTTADARATWASPKPQHDLVIESKSACWLSELTEHRIEWLQAQIGAA